LVQILGATNPIKSMVCEIVNLRTDLNLVVAIIFTLCYNKLMKN